MYQRPAARLTSIVTTPLHLLCVLLVLGLGAGSVALPVATTAASPAVHPGLDRAPSTAQETGSGLSATYFDTTALTGPSVSRVDPQVAFDWGFGAPAAGIGVDRFSVRWTGQVQPKFSETYIFSTTTDDGARLWVDGRLLIDRWQLQAPTTHSAKIALEAGRKYTIRLEYFENTQAAMAQLLWSSPSTPKQPIPTNALYPTVGGSPPPPPPGPGASYPRRSLVGMNLGGPADWNPQFQFVDVIKAARPWSPVGFAGPVAVDARGYPLLQPGQRAESFVIGTDVPGGRYPAGRYVMTWEGSGEVYLRKWAVTQTYVDRPGRIEVEVDPGQGGLVVEIFRSDLDNPVRDLHLWMPGYEGAAYAFHPLFEQLLQPFGTIRFMDFQGTNNNPISRWADRTTVDDFSYSVPGGTPLELMIEFSNRNRVDPWFCIPHLADDDYVRNFARMVRDRLDPGLKVYIEHSNEVWNGVFDQAHYARTRGQALGLTDPAADPAGFQAQLRYHSQRSVEIFTIFEQEFGGTSRLVRVMGTQAGNPWVARELLTWRDAHRQVDGVAASSYFGDAFGDPARQHEVAAWSVEYLLDRVFEDINTRSLEQIQTQVAISREFGKRPLSYEGGQHLVGHGGAQENAALTDLFIAANRHPRMYDLYQQHLANWFDQGGDVNVQFSFVAQPSKYGSWGMMEQMYQTEAEAPKRRAIVDFIRRPLP